MCVCCNDIVEYKKKTTTITLSSSFVGCVSVGWLFCRCAQRKKKMNITKHREKKNVEIIISFRDYYTILCTPFSISIYCIFVVVLFDFPTCSGSVHIHFWLVVRVWVSSLCIQSDVFVNRTPKNCLWVA